MNDAGDFYIGNKRVSSIDGTEQTFNVPVPTTTGSDVESAATSGRLDVIFDSVTVREGLIVDGNNNTTVKLNAPVSVSEKLTSSSTDGVEVVSLDITGGLAQPRTLTYSSSQPTDAGTEGDIIFNSSPTFGQYAGWIYTQQGWKRWGFISTEIDENQLSVDQIGIGSTSAGRLGSQTGIDVRGQIVGDNHLIVGVATFLGSTSFTDITFSQSRTGVGTVTTYLHVTGDANLAGISTVADARVTDLQVSAGSTFNGNVDIGNATSDTLTITSRVDSRIDPSADATYDLGAGANRWRNLVVSGVASATSFVGDLTGDVTGNITGDLTGDVTGNLVGAGGSFTGAVTVSAASTNQSYNITFASGTSGYRQIEASTALTFNPSTQVFSNASDERLKTNIVGITNAIEKVQRLRGVEYDWRMNGEHSVGVIAQDVERVVPELVSVNTETGMKGVDYGKLNALLIEAIKEQQIQINALKDRLDQLTK